MQRIAHIYINTGVELPIGKGMIRGLLGCQDPYLVKVVARLSLSMRVYLGLIPSMNHLILWKSQVRDLLNTKKPSIVAFKPILLEHQLLHSRQAKVKPLPLRENVNSALYE